MSDQDVSVISSFSNSIITHNLFMAWACLWYSRPHFDTVVGNGVEVIYAAQCWFM